MNKIVAKEYLSERVVKFEVEAPLIAKSRKAGHFVIVRVGKKGERVPYTIASADIKKGTITLVVQRVGKSSEKLCSLEPGEYITDMVGPLGKATHIENFGTVVCAGGGVGVAPMLPIIEAMKKAGNRVISVLAARTKELVILEEQVRQYSDEVVIMTDDGSYGEKGLITDGIENVKVICMDVTIPNSAALKNGKIDFLIGQGPEYQGFYAMKTLLEYLIFRKSVTLENYMQLDIITKETIEYYKRFNNLLR
jgi:NAD(P)H-flavin reductase